MCNIFFHKKRKKEKKADIIAAGGIYSYLWENFFIFLEEK
jgi:hypothetical protein